jgi:hypothetical protein
MEYRYYVSFSHQVDGYVVSTAGMDLNRTAPIASQEDVRALAAELTVGGFKKVTVLGFSRYENEG